MLSWDEKITPTVSLLPSFCLPENHLAERITHRSAKLHSVFSAVLTAAASAAQAGHQSVLACHVRATDKRAGTGKTDVNQAMTCKRQWAH